MKQRTRLVHGTQEEEEEEFGWVCLFVLSSLWARSSHVLLTVSVSAARAWGSRGSRSLRRRRVVPGAGVEEEPEVTRGAVTSWGVEIVDGVTGVLTAWAR